MLDRDGNRIDRRNPQDIFVPLYNKQIPPGAGQVVHFGLDVPEGVEGPITLEAKVNYRKFDRKYMDYIFGKGQGARAARRRDGERPRRAARRGGPDGDEPALADQGGLAALERLRDRPLPRRGREGGPEGRAEAGRAGLPEGGRARARPTAG